MILDSARICDFIEAAQPARCFRCGHTTGESSRPRRSFEGPLEGMVEVKP
jgi:hypothetical protein